MEFLDQVIERFISLVQAPFTNEVMLWSAIPLVLATLFMTLYFGKYGKEELNWDSAFGNTMVFLFVSIDLLRHIYYTHGEGSFEILFSNTFYASIAISLGIVGVLLMIVTYYHLLPKKLALFLFSAAPVNVCVYVLMTIVYNNVSPDLVTLVAGLLLFGIIFGILKGLQLLEHMASKPEGLSLSPEENLEDRYLKQLKEKNKKILEGKKRITEELGKEGAKTQDEKPK